MKLGISLSFAALVDAVDALELPGERALAARDVEDRARLQRRAAEGVQEPRRELRVARGVRALLRVVEVRVLVAPRRLRGTRILNPTSMCA